jgi:D-arabinose 1-dehydrogenase-like Zn-dependent alcohol dehydrogenase
LATSNSWKATNAAIAGLRPDGRLILMGVSSESLEETPEPLFKRARVIGSMQNSPEYLYEALDYAAKGRVKEIAETYPLADIGQAYARVAAGEVRFRAVITR